jgi:SAM-dependent methyltransferase
MKTYTSSVIVKPRGNQIFGQHGWGSALSETLLSSEMLLALEIGLFEHDVSLAAARYAELAATSVPESVRKLLDQLEAGPLQNIEHRALRVGRAGFYLVDNKRRDLLLNLLETSRQSPQILREFAERRGLPRPPPLSASEFRSLLEELRERGFVAPDVNQIDWGDLRRARPMCPLFGFGRGTPIDRYYLDRFVDAIRDDVRGDVVEVGGRSKNRELYRFASAGRYRGLDMHPLADVDLVGDIHDPALLPAASLDGLVAFNVLEHCKQPWIVVDNFKRWLRPGGKAFVMVPSSQRVHRVPEDYWRPLPAALESMFGGWSSRQLHVYGNPISALAAFQGIAVEELEPAELNAEHPDFPVASCIVATN